jgi:hypothetical protein
LRERERESEKERERESEREAHAQNSYTVTCCREYTRALTVMVG